MIDTFTYYKHTGMQSISKSTLANNFDIDTFDLNFENDAWCIETSIDNTFNLLVKLFKKQLIMRSHQTAVQRKRSHIVLAMLD